MSPQVSVKNLKNDSLNRVPVTDCRQSHLKVLEIRMEIQISNLTLSTLRSVPRKL